MWPQSRMSILHWPFSLFLFSLSFLSLSLSLCPFLQLLLSPPCSIEKVSKITSPVLIIHGTEDEVIDFSHGLALFERCPKAVEPLWVEGAGHNDIELYSQYLERLRRFIGTELAAPHAWEPPLPSPPPLTHTHTHTHTNWVSVTWPCLWLC